MLALGGGNAPGETLGIQSASIRGRKRVQLLAKISAGERSSEEK